MLALRQGADQVVGPGTDGGGGVGNQVEDPLPPLFIYTCRISNLLPSREHTGLEVQIQVFQRFEVNGKLT
jgi:hypothetical protein